METFQDENEAAARSARHCRAQATSGQRRVGGYRHRRRATPAEQRWENKTRSMTQQFPKENAPTQAGRFSSRPGAHPPRRSSNGRLQGVRRISPATSDTTKSTRKMKNSTFAISAAPAAIPVKPKTAATIATMKNTNA